MEDYTVCAVVVTYNIGKKYIESFNTLYGQVDKIIIVDNGSDEETIAVLQELQKNYKNVEVIFNSENLGIGVAQNIGISKAIEENFDWVLLLDHDSKLQPNMVKNMIEYYKKLPENEKQKIGMIAPWICYINLGNYKNYTVWNNGHFKRVKYNKENIENAVDTLASGSLIRTEVFKKIGLMREDYFIDFVDIEFNFRLISSGFKSVVLHDVILYHTIGNGTKKVKIFGETIYSYDYPPIRYYYIFRNGIHLIKERILLDNKCIKYSPYIFIDLIMRFLWVFFYEQYKLRKLYFIFKGIYDGLKGKFGD